MNPPVKMMLIFVDETETLGGSRVPLYEGIVEFLLHAGISGATVHTGIMGFGANRQMHRKGLFGVVASTSERRADAWATSLVRAPIVSRIAAEFFIGSTTSSLFLYAVRCFCTSSSAASDCCTSRRAASTRSLRARSFRRLTISSATSSNATAIVTESSGRNVATASSVIPLLLLVTI